MLYNRKFLFLISLVMDIQTNLTDFLCYYSL